MNAKIITSFAVAGVWGLVMVLFLIHWGDGDSALAAFFGLPFGWALGVVLAPYDEERLKFEKWSKGLFGLVSGVTITKLYDWFNGMSESQKQQLWNELVLRRFAFGISSFLVTAIVVFVARSYWQAEQNQS